MILGSLATAFDSLQGSVAAGGYFLGQLLGYGGGSAMEGAATFFETLYGTSGQPIPDLISEIL